MTILKTTMKERTIFMTVKGSFFSGILADVSFSNNLSSGMEKFLSTISFVIFRDFVMFYQLLPSPQVKLCAIITYKHGI